MNFINNMTVKTKLIFLAIVLLFGLAVVSFSGNHGINSCGDALIEISEVRLPSTIFVLNSTLIVSFFYSYSTLLFYLLILL